MRELGSNSDILSSSKKKILMKRFVFTAQWPRVELNIANSMEVMVRKVGEAYKRQVPIFARKVKFPELMQVKGEGYIQWANRNNQQSELANMEGIKAQDLQLMKYCQGLQKTDRLYDKLMDLEVKKWATAQKLIKKYVQSQALKADLVESAPKNQGHIVMKLSGDSSPAQGPSRGGEAQGGGRSPSNSRLCWNCDEVVTGDHFANTFPKPKKKEDPNRSVTPYSRA